MTEPSKRPARGVAIAVLLAAAWAAAAPAAVAPEAAIVAQSEIPEDRLLDVGIQVLDPGIPAAERAALEDEGIFEEIRKSEARFVPVRLMETLQATGQWGAVRVVPAGVDSVDLVVSGKILESTGLELALEIAAVDATGHRWLEKKYKQKADPLAYEAGDEALGREPFQNLYNRIANDLLAAREKRDDPELRQIREVARLRFAAELVPDAFDGYLGRDRRGRTVVERLPAEDDAMMARVAEVRDRDYLFIDTLNEHYAGFSARMAGPYDDWRQYTYEEETKLRKLKRQARLQKILGAVAVVGGILANDGSREGRVISEAGVVGGVIAIRSGIFKTQEAKLHRETLRELAASFDAEITPVLVEVEGQTLRLQGSVETQYARWRELLREIFVTETGLPVDPDTGGLASAEH